ncbi:MAG TPA: hypothetical protein VLM89_07835 [Phycisphaerae bacterium]|nr:hypothetical protein [Phycisphaerae bacterium]
MENATQTKVARQVLEIERSCKHSIRYVPRPNTAAEVVLADGSGKAVDEIASVVYVSKEVLALLGNPKHVVLSVEAIE